MGFGKGQVGVWIYRTYGGKHMGSISGEKKSHGEKSGPWEKDCHGESFVGGEDYGYNGDGRSHSHGDGEAHGVLTSGCYGSAGD